MWFSVRYLGLAEATVITFLSPAGAGWLCWMLLGERFTRREQVGGVLALLGVVMITRPGSLVAALRGQGQEGEGGAAVVEVVDAVVNATTTTGPVPDDGGGGGHVDWAAEDVTPAQRLMAIAMALLGVVGGAGAISTLRAIGERAHPLVSVNYFSSWCSVVSFTVLALAPYLPLPLSPELHLMSPLDLSWTQVGLIVWICGCGLVMQILVTLSLAYERSNRALAMVYTHMLFAAAFDRWVFGTRMGWWSVAGCWVIVGSALWVTLGKKEGGDGTTRLGDLENNGRAVAVGEEEGAVLLREGRNSCDDVDDEVALELRRQ
ncbi:hypothetical protein F5Y15DRAFT_375440 [Xylariaceae sp. FL0016]|nr:hypothetical protein F5Y15DRAFT_375440 [Xylariaceae sp. FL0016]